MKIYQKLTPFLTEKLIGEIRDYIVDYHKSNTTQWLYKIAICPVTNFKFENVNVTLYFVGEHGSQFENTHTFEADAYQVRILKENDIEWYKLLYVELCKYLNNDFNNFFSCEKNIHIFELTNVARQLRGKEFYNIGVLEYALQADPYDTSVSFSIKTGENGRYAHHLFSKFFGVKMNVMFDSRTEVVSLFRNSIILKSKYFKEIRESRAAAVENLESAKRYLDAVDNIIESFSPDDRLLFEMEE